MARRARLLLFRSRVDEELDAELQHHIDLESAELVSHGWSPAAARREALRKFGGLDRTKERVRDERGGRLALDSMQDLRYAGRSLRKSPAFTLSAVAVLALGIGSTAAIYSLVDAVLLSPLPYADPEELVQIWESSPEGSAESRVSGANARLWSEEAGSLSAIGMYRTGRTATLHGVDDPELIVVADLQPSVWRVLGVSALTGRYFLDEDEAGDDRVVVLGFGTWQQRFGADPAAVGQTVTIDDLPYLVVGVMPRGFDFPVTGVDAWMPLTRQDPGMDPNDRSTRALLAVGRLAQGSSPASAQAEMGAIASRVEHPDTRGWGVRIVPLQTEVTSESRGVLTLLLAAVGLLLVVACANLANMLLARGVARELEIAVRTAMGAGRGRILRQLLTESALLACLGTAGAILLAPLLLGLFVAMAPADVPLIDRAAIDLPVLLFSGLLAVSCALGFGLAPALHQTRTTARRTMRTRSPSSHSGHARLRASLLVGQVSVAVVLLVGAGLLVRTSSALATAELGFDDRGLLTMTVVIPIPRYPTLEQQTRFFDRLATRVEEIPEVVAATGSTGAPGLAGSLAYPFLVEGRTARTLTGHEAPEAVRLVGPDYFGVIGQPVRAGRDLSRDDRIDSPWVVVINEAMASRYWPGGDPLGHRIALVGEELRGERGPWREIVGVVSDARLEGPDDVSTPRFYLPYAQRSAVWWNWMSVIARVEANDDVPAVHREMRAALAELDPALPPRGLGSVEDAYRAGRSSHNFATTLGVAFSGCALLLVVFGLYGLITFHVLCRRKEIGLRMALGAGWRTLVRDVLWRSLSLAGAGAALGASVSLVATRGIESMLFEVTPADATVYAVSLTVVLVAALIAASVPALRAVRTSPLRALSWD